VIPLRPIAVGEILDGAFTSVRRNPKATLGIAAIVLTIAGVITTAASIALARVAGPVNLPSPGQTLSPAQTSQLLSNVVTYLVPVAAVTVIVDLIVRLILTGLLTVVVGRGVLGSRITAGQAWRIARPRLPALLGVTLWLMLVVIAPWAVLAGVLVLLGLSGAPAGPVVAAVLLGFLAAAVLDVWFWVMLSMVTPVVVLERQRPLAALARSWRLVRRSFWRVFGILLLVAVIVGIAGLILGLPFTFAAGAASFGNLGQALQPGITGHFISAVGGIVSGTVTIPISAGVTVLLYVDLRMRREGLDLILQGATAPGQQSGDEYATIWRPGTGSAGAGAGGPGATAAPGTGYGQSPAVGWGPSPPAPGGPPQR
jgi:hypothetical protein